MSTTARRLAGASVLAIAVTTVVAGPASAHVSVSPEQASQGGFSALTFRAPNERDDASATKLQVAFPTDTPLAFVSVKPIPGWSYHVTKTTLAQPIQSDDGPVSEAVSEIDWTADSPASAVKPGEYQEFPVSVGPLPKTAAISFKALQTYSDGNVVRWIDQQIPGAPEAEHPAPTLQLTPAGAETAGTVTTSAAAPAAPAAQAPDDSASKSSVQVATGLGLAGVALGALGGLLGGAALARLQTELESHASTEGLSDHAGATAVEVLVAGLAE
ncbi:MAG: hypothetical protein QOH03_431, partial [Kribbellaceae bacterium]|nr:hypothetical protein [Kribbellaceae bacterium]